MPNIKLDAVERLTAAWTAAYPSEINDAFCRVINNKIQRALTFKMSRSDINNLIGTETTYLELHYGYDKESDDGEYAFKPIILGLDNKRQVLSAVSFDVVEFSDASQDIPEEVWIDMISHIPQHLNEKGKTHRKVKIDPDQESVEYISPVTEKWMFYKWLSCRPSELIDQFETIYQGQRIRIEHSDFDESVTRYFKRKLQSGDFTVYLFLGLHDVIPGDRRVFHFAPILRTYGDLAVHFVADSVNIELSTPCPPC